MPDPISNLRILPSETAAIGGGVAPREWGFMETLQGAMDHSKALQSAADAKVAGLLDGSGVDVHTAMIAVEQSDLSFQLMMQVRNKIVAAYQEISRMQF
jgi:flagellar hook-basal body complex protein FliE